MEYKSESHIFQQAFIAGNEGAFTRLFQIYSDALFFYGGTFTNDRELIKDSIQELFSDLWERKGQCPEVNNVKQFLLIALRRIIFRKIQRKKRLVLTSSKKDNTLNTSFFAETAEEIIIHQEINTQIQNNLRKSIQGLPPRQKEAIHLRYFQGFSYEEIASVMNIQKGSVGHFITQAIVKLRKSMNTSIASFPLLFFFFFFL